jgi:hypothetical protein
MTKLITLIQSTGEVEFLERFGSTDQALDSSNFCSVVMTGMKSYNSFLQVTACGCQHEEDKCQAEASKWTGMLMDDYRQACVGLVNKTGTECVFLDSRVKAFTDYDCMEISTLKSNLEIYYGEDLDYVLQAAVKEENTTRKFEWDPVGVCYEIQAINVKLDYTRKMNSCQTWKNDGPIYTNEISGNYFNDSKHFYNNSDLPDVPPEIDNSVCAGKDRINCLKYKTCCHYTIFLNQFEVFENICVNMQAYVYYLIPDQVEALNKAGLTGVEDTRITMSNFCQVLEHEQNGGDYIEKCSCYGQSEKNFSGLLGLKSGLGLLGLISFLILTLKF